MDIFQLFLNTKSISKLNRKQLEDENWLLANTLRQRRKRKTEKKEIYAVKLGGKKQN